MRCWLLQQGYGGEGDGEGGWGFLTLCRRLI